jgi:hypothetical protein
MKWLWDYAQGVSATYGVDPRIYLALVLVTIPPFYLALGFVVRDLARTRNGQGGMSVARAMGSRTFGIALASVVVLWLVPYLYVALWGRRLPVWFTVVLVGLMVAGGISLVRRIRRQATTGDANGEQE